MVVLRVLSLGFEEILVCATAVWRFLWPVGVRLPMDSRRIVVDATFVERYAYVNRGGQGVNNVALENLCNVSMAEVCRQGVGIIVSVSWRGAGVHLHVLVLLVSVIVSDFLVICRGEREKRKRYGGKEIAVLPRLETGRVCCNNLI